MEFANNIFYAAKSLNLTFIWWFVYKCISLGLLITTKLKTMTATQIKQKGVLHSRENECELYQVIGTWNKAAKKPDMHWYMISEKTGIHCITTQSNRPDERVLAHWQGFKDNQNR